MTRLILVVAVLTSVVLAGCPEKQVAVPTTAEKPVETPKMMWEYTFVSGKPFHRTILKQRTNTVGDPYFFDGVFPNEWGEADETGIEHRKGVIGVYYIDATDKPYPPFEKLFTSDGSPVTNKPGAR